MNERQKKKHILRLLNMSKKKIYHLDESELIKVITDVDEIRIESVNEGRFLGKIIRCR